MSDITRFAFFFFITIYPKKKDMRWSLTTLTHFFYCLKDKEVETMATKRPRKAYKRIGFEDRKKIEMLNAQGKTVDEMALAIGVHSATMYRELARGGEPYRAEVAQHSI